MSRFSSAGKVYYVCTVRKYKKGTHCKEFTDEVILSTRPCDPARAPGAPSPCQKEKLHKVHRHRSKRKKTRKYHLPPGTPRYREQHQVDVPVYLGREWARNWNDGGAYLYNFQHYTSVPPERLAWINGKRCWDQTNPPPPRSWHDLYRVSTTGVHLLPRADVGGPLRIIETRSGHNVPEGDVHVDDGPYGVQRGYDGSFAPEDFGGFGSNDLDFAGNWVIEPERSLGDPEPYGPIGWDRFKPRIQQVDLPLAIYELKDLPDQLATSAEGFRDLYKAAKGRSLREGAHLLGPKHVSEHFLNHVFGWVPFVGDVTKTLGAVRDQNKKLQKLIQNNGQWVHRGGTISKSPLTLISEYDDVARFPRIYPALDTHLLRTVEYPDGIYRYGQSSYSLYKAERIWFVGEFKYYLPSLARDHENLYHMINLLHYYGARISPDLIWKATPWTWLFDWFGDTGRLMTEMSDRANDNLVCRYAYVMRTVEYHKVHRAVLHLRDGSDQHFSWTQNILSKRRARASPFGFGLSSGDLSAKQLAILAAIGITRI
ncbi:TPA_asm: maturation protein [ssRNA phage Gephyllon.2_1]|uniref:Maturation protein n=2 Tax=Leviviricetes TaxID=2842243 RepID=A0A8S5L3B2_9VIRU|nr:maturation protein [ssRNA phage Gephyllon.2_1]QDH88961.1 MAG: hypothetical protein H2BulkLitter10371_000003 [Leviviridae sp.]DAD51813.1 TPA_asm: maturation protein [ssRNA phage Gephyllon.2_1]